MTHVLQEVMKFSSHRIMLLGILVASAGEDVTFDEDNCTVNDISTTGAVRYVRVILS